MELPKIKLEQLELEQKVNETPLFIHIKCNISMRYDISKATATAMPNLGEGQNISVFCFLRRQKTCTNRWFRCFSPYLALTSARRISAHRPHLEGAKGHNGQSGGRFGL